MKKVGIWLDQKEANVITLFENTQQNKIIYSDIETRERFKGETKQFGRFGEQFLNYEKGQQKRIEDLTNRYLNKIIEEINNVDEIMLFGPAQTKNKLEKLILINPNLSSKLKGVQVSDSMTKNQKIAYVKNYFK